MQLSDRLLLANMQKMENEAVELGLPAHLLWVCADQLRAQGWELRPDTFMHLSRAAEAAVSGLMPAAMLRVAKRIDEAATFLLRDMSFDDPRDALVSCAMLVLKLVDEKLFRDTQNQAVLVSLLLVDDAIDSGSDLPFNEHKLRTTAGIMLQRLVVMGYYNVCPGGATSLVSH